MSKFLVTGGAGFIGSNIVEELLSLGHQVRVLDNYATGRKENLAPFLGRFEMLEGDITDIKLCRQAVQGIEYVLHQGALPSVPRSINDPIKSNLANINGTLNILIAARDAGVRKVVYASSSSVYGNTPVLPKVETMIPNPLSPYAVSKLGGEYYCRVFKNIYGLNAVALRYFNVFGPKQDPASQYAAVIPKFIDSYLRGQPPQIHGDGEQSRDFTYVANVVSANIKAATSDASGGEVANIACGQRITLNQVATLIQKYLGLRSAPVHIDPRPGDVKHSLADISKARELFGYEPVVQFEQGLKATIEWFKHDREGKSKNG